MHSPGEIRERQREKESCGIECVREMVRGLRYRGKEDCGCILEMLIFQKQRERYEESSGRERERE